MCLHLPKMIYKIIFCVSIVVMVSPRNGEIEQTPGAEKLVG